MQVKKWDDRATGPAGSLQTREGESWYLARRLTCSHIVCTTSHCISE